MNHCLIMINWIEVPVTTIICYYNNIIVEIGSPPCSGGRDQSTQSSPGIPGRELLFLRKQIEREQNIGSVVEWNTMVTLLIE